MQWFANNIVETVLILGVALLILEVLVLGFSTFFLFFVGIAALITSLLMWLGILPETYMATLLSLSGFTALLAATLWKKMANLQNAVDDKRAKSDLIGHSFVLEADVSTDMPRDAMPRYHYSGINWRLQARKDIVKGTVVEVEQTDVGVLTIKAK